MISYDELTRTCQNQFQRNHWLFLSIENHGTWSLEIVSRKSAVERYSGRHLYKGLCDILVHNNTQLSHSKNSCGAPAISRDPITAVSAGTDWLDRWLRRISGNDLLKEILALNIVYIVTFLDLLIVPLKIFNSSNYPINVIQLNQMKPVNLKCAPS